MAQRVLAVLGAVAIVLAAIAVRAAIDDGDDRARDGDRGADGALVVICAEDLADACAALDRVTVVEEEAATTAAQLAAGSLPDGADAWLTTTAWTEVTDVRSPGVIDRQVALATSPVVVAVDPGRSDAVRTLCGDVALWRCLGDATGSDWGQIGGDARWGSFRVGLPSASSATGLGVLASVASGYFGSTDFARNDFDASTFPGWLDALTDPSAAGERDPVATLVTARGRYTAVGAIAAATPGRAVDVLDPAPAVEVTATLAVLPGGDDVDDDGDLVGALREALVADGWSAATGGAPAPTLAVPGVLAALHSLWAEVAR